MFDKLTLIFALANLAWSFYLEYFKGETLKANNRLGWAIVLILTATAL